MAQSSASRTETWQISFKESLLLIGLLVPVVLYCVAAKIDCRCGGKPEAGAWSSLRTLTTVTEEFRRRFQIYPLALTDLSDEALQPRPYIDSALGFGIKNGYTYTYLSTANSWNCTAIPIKRSRGARSFFVDQSGVIRVEPAFTTNGAATAASAPIE